MMSSQSSNPVAVETRIDLASLFCMAARHGPAVALALVAVMSVLVGILIYRRVRRKRRMATPPAASGMKCVRTKGEAVAVVTDRSSEEGQKPSESTDASDNSSDLKVHIRHRHSPAERKPCLYLPPHCESSPDDTSPVWNDGIAAEEHAVLQRVFHEDKKLPFADVPDILNSQEETKQSSQHPLPSANFDGHQKMSDMLPIHQAYSEEDSIHSDDRSTSPLCHSEFATFEENTCPIEAIKQIAAKEQDIGQNVSDHRVDYQQAGSLPQEPCTFKQYSPKRLGEIIASNYSGEHDKAAVVTEKVVVDHLNKLISDTQLQQLKIKSEKLSNEAQPYLEKEKCGQSSEVMAEVAFHFNEYADCNNEGHLLNFEGPQQDADECSDNITMSIQSNENQISKGIERSKGNAHKESCVADVGVQLGRVTDISKIMQTTNDKMCPSSEIVEEVGDEVCLSALNCYKLDSTIEQELSISKRDKRTLPTKKEMDEVEMKTSLLTNMPAELSIINYPNISSDNLCSGAKAKDFENTQDKVHTTEGNQMHDVAAFPLVDLKTTPKMPESHTEETPSPAMKQGNSLLSLDCEAEIGISAIAVSHDLQEVGDGLNVFPEIRQVVNTPISQKEKTVFGSEKIMASIYSGEQDQTPELMGEVVVKCVPHLLQTDVCQQEECVKCSIDGLQTSEAIQHIEEKEVDEQELEEVLSVSTDTVPTMEDHVTDPTSEKNGAIKDNTLTQNAQCINFKTNALQKKQERQILPMDDIAVSFSEKSEVEELKKSSVFCFKSESAKPESALNISLNHPGELKEAFTDIQSETSVTDHVVKMDPDILQPQSTVQESVPILELQPPIENFPFISDSLKCGTVGVDVHAPVSSFTEDLQSEREEKFKTIQQPLENFSDEDDIYEAAGLCPIFSTGTFFAANEDMCGHDIEESYFGALDEEIEKIGDGLTNTTYEIGKMFDTTSSVEVVELKQEDREDEMIQDYATTEISIMEATMNNNEWITEGNDQFLPWTNSSDMAYSPKFTKSSSPSAEKHHHHPKLSVPSSNMDKLCTNTLKTVGHSDLEKNTETGKKIVVIQPMAQSVTVTFRVHYLTQSPFQKVAITGSHPELGNWKNFVSLENDKDGNWSTVVSLPVESHMEWKFVVVDQGNVCRWEECGNRLLDTGNGEDMIVKEWWGFL